MLYNIYVKRVSLQPSVADDCKKGSDLLCVLEKKLSSILVQTDV